eukprot:TRINITY_DN43620_c0_g1_i1.p1 TRINITY_DN43620_c0_g1~~TRINITY_DN43620_c0_g1_i1.p1  ORF type:complete len:511 (+),score=74.48 TRINITY_DN43620_c0_g1_i1:55-1587(+)
MAVVDDDTTIVAIIAAASGCCILACGMVCCWRDAARRDISSRRRSEEDAYREHEKLEMVRDRDTAHEAGGNVHVDFSPDALGADANLLLLGNGFRMPVRRLDACAQGRRLAKAAVSKAKSATSGKRVRGGRNNAERSFVKVMAPSFEDERSQREDNLARMFGTLAAVAPEDNASETSTPRRPKRSKPELSVAPSRNSAKIPAKVLGVQSTSATNPLRSAAAAASVRPHTSCRADVASTAAAPAAAVKNACHDPGSSREGGRDSGFDGSRAFVGGCFPASLSPLGADAEAKRLVEVAEDTIGVPSLPLKPEVPPSSPLPQEALQVEVGHFEQVCDDDGDAANDLCDGGDLLCQIEMPQSLQDGQNVNSPPASAFRRAREEKFDCLDAELAIELEDGHAFSLVLDPKLFPRTHAGLPSNLAPAYGAGSTGARAGDRRGSSHGRKHTRTSSSSPARRQRRDGSSSSPSRPAVADSAIDQRGVESASSKTSISRHGSPGPTTGAVLLGRESQTG